MKTMKRCKRFAAKERGIVALEFVLVLPFLLMVLFGIIDTSLLLCDKAVITNAAGEAARAGIVVRAQPLTESQIQSVALSYAQNTLVTGGTATTPTVAVSPPEACTLVGSSGKAINVTVSYTYKGLVLGSALSSLTGPVTVTAVAVKNCE
jgi:Flp pilus assembly protein TadG